MAVFLDEVVVGCSGSRFALLGRAIVTSQDGLELLSDADGNHAGLGGRLEERLDHIDVPITFGKPMTGIWCRLAKLATATRKALPIRLDQGWGGDGLMRCWLKKVTTWPLTCRVGT